MSANCLTKFNPLKEVLTNLWGVSDQLDKVDYVLSMLINSSSDNVDTTASTAAAAAMVARLKRQGVVVTTVTTAQVITVVTRYQTVITTKGKHAKNSNPVL